MINWLDWTSDTIDLSNYPGQTFTASFTAYDCALGGHFGYGYLMAYCVTPISRLWTGISDSEWDNPANWDPQGVPAATDEVTIPSSAPNMPVVNISGMVCKDLHIALGASLTIPEGITLTVNGNVQFDMP